MIFEISYFEAFYILDYKKNFKEKKHSILKKDSTYYSIVFYKENYIRGGLLEFIIQHNSMGKFENRRVFQSYWHFIIPLKESITGINKYCDVIDNQRYTKSYICIKSSYIAPF